MIDDAEKRSAEGTLAVGRAPIRLEGRGLEDPGILETLLRSRDVKTLEELTG